MSFRGMPQIYFWRTRHSVACFFYWKTGAFALDPPGIRPNTGTVKEAQRLVEYADFPCGTAMSDLRIRNGQKEPFNIRTWCLGNELDGEWQINHKTAYEYGRIVAETARVLHTMDPALELVAVGSSSDKMPTYGILQGGDRSDAGQQSGLWKERLHANHFPQCT